LSCVIGVLAGSVVATAGTENKNHGRYKYQGPSHNQPLSASPYRLSDTNCRGNAAISTQIAYLWTVSNLPADSPTRAPKCSPPICADMGGWEAVCPHDGALQLRYGYARRVKGYSCEPAV
jgi:hypothetical protein